MWNPRGLDGQGKEGVRKGVRQGPGNRRKGNAADPRAQNGEQQRTFPATQLYIPGVALCGHAGGRRGACAEPQLHEKHGSDPEEDQSRRVAACEARHVQAMPSRADPAAHHGDGHRERLQEGQAPGQQERRACVQLQMRDAEAVPHRQTAGLSTARREAGQRHRYRSTVESICNIKVLHRAVSYVYRDEMRPRCAALQKFVVVLVVIGCTLQLPALGEHTEALVVSAEPVPVPADLVRDQLSEPKHQPVDKREHQVDRTRPCKRQDLPKGNPVF